MTNDLSKRVTLQTHVYGEVDWVWTAPVKSQKNFNFKTIIVTIIWDGLSVDLNVKNV